MFGLSLEWPRCPDGVTLHKYGERDPSKSILSGEPAGKWVRYRTERQILAHYEISDLENPVVLRFVNARDDDALIDFLSRFGLTSGGWTASDGAKEIDWQGVKKNQRALRLLLQQLDGGSPIETAVKRINAAFARLKGFAPIPVLDFSGPGDGPRLALRPQSLLQFMLMEVAMIAASGARTTTCQHCGKMFATGHLTRRRSRALYCDDRCRVAAMRKRNKAASK